MVKAAERLFVAIAPLRLSHKLCVIIYATILDVLNDHLSEAVFLCRSLAVNIQPEVLRQRGARFLQVMFYWSRMVDGKEPAVSKGASDSIKRGGGRSSAPKVIYRRCKGHSG